MHPPALSNRLRRTHLPQYKPPEYVKVEGPAQTPFASTTSTANWAGVQETSNAPYSTASVAFTLPTITSSTASSILIWAGFDGGGSQSSIIEQAGFYGINTGGGSPTASWQAWLECFPASEEFWNSSSYPCATGDSVSISLTYSTATQYEAAGPVGEFTANLHNSTKSWNYTINKSVRAINVEENVTSRVAPQSVEFIIESVGGLIADFGTLTFSSISTTPTINNPIYITMKPAATNDVTPGTISGSSLVMTWHAYS